ncbi:unnamed protein product [Prunus armeniaca]
MSLLIMKRAMTETVRGGILSNDKTKAFLEAVGEKFKESKKVETGSLMNALTTMRYDGESSVREYIMKLIDIANKLKDLEVTISDPFLVHVALNSLPPKFGQLKVSYNTQKENWDLNKLISMCVQEEDRLKCDKMEVVNLVHSTDGKKNGASGYGKPFHAFKSSNAFAKTAQPPPKGSQSVKVNKTKIFKCYFCKKSGHMKKDYDKYKRWLIKKCISNFCVCIESNLVVVPMNSWWFGTGSSVHITNTL